MAQTIKLKRSAQSGASGIPSTSDLALGEVGINTYHGKMYIKKDDGTESIVDVGGLPLSGGTLTGNLSLGDNVKAQFGASNDLQIYHDGSASYIADVGTGDLVLQAGNDLILRQPDGSTEYLRANEGAGVQIYHNGSQKFLTTAAGIDVTGTVTADGLTVDTGSTFALSATLGHTGGSQLFFLNDDGGSRNQIDSQKNSASADLDLATGGVKRQKIANNGDISFYNDSAAQAFYWDSSTSRLGLGTTNPANKLEISGGNIRIINQSTGRITFNNGSTEAYFGFNGAGSSTLNSGSQPLQIQAQGSNHIQFDTNSVERLKINADGSSVFSGSVSATKAGYNANGSAWAESAYASSGSYGGGYSIIDGSAGFLLHAQSSGTQFVIRQGTVGSNPSTLLTMNSSGNLNLTNGSLMVGSTTAPTGLLSFQTSTAGNNTTHNIIDATTDNPTYKAQINLIREGSSGQLGWAFLTNSVGSPTERLRISHDGSVGIGTNNPSQKLHVVGTSRPALFGSDTAVNIVKLYNSATGSGTYNGLDLLVNSTANSQINAYGMPLTFGTSASNGTNVTERMRISSDGSCRWTPDGTNHDMTLTADGNLLVGKTSSSFTTAGVELAVGGVAGKVQIQRSSSPLALVNLTDDGNILSFYKGTSAVGSIATTSGRLSIGSNDVGLFFDSTNERFTPIHQTNQADRDGAIDLGYSDSRFKDLYLSSSIKLSNSSYDTGATVTTSISGDLITGQADTGLRFYDGGDAIIPRSTSDGQRNGTTDLGASNARFKDLYLSNNATAQKLTLTKDPVGTYSIEVDGTNTGQPNLIVKQSTSERLRIDNLGRVGIGTSSPSAPLTVNNNTDHSDVAIFHAGGGTPNRGLKISTFSNTNSNAGVELDAQTATGAFKFSTGGTERMRIDSSGNVGIGQNPSGFLTSGYVARLYGGAQTYIAFNNSTHTTQVIGGFVIGNDYVSARITQRENQPIIFDTNDTERMRIDSSGNLLVGTTSTSLYNDTSGGGINLFANGGVTLAKQATSVSDPVLLLNNTGTAGQMIDLRQDGTTVGSIGTSNGDITIDASGGAGVLKASGTGQLAWANNLFYPITDNAKNLGTSSFRFKDLYLSGGVNIGDAKTVGHGAISLKYDLVYMTAGVISPADDDGTDNDNSVDLGKSAARFNDIFATNGTIQTSDRNEKQDIESLTEAEERVAVAAKGLLKKFRWKSAVEDKGDDARIHFGIIAQDLQAAFEAEGLDAGRYGMFTSNTWTNEDGEEQTRMGVRYSELLAFIISAI